ISGAPAARAQARAATERRGDKTLRGEPASGSRLPLTGCGCASMIFSFLNWLLVGQQEECQPRGGEKQCVSRTDVVLFPTVTVAVESVSAAEGAKKIRG